MKIATAAAITLGLLAAAVPVPDSRAQDAPARVGPGRPDNSPEALRAQLIRSLEREELEHALYAYESLFHVTGEEDLQLLGQVARLSVVDNLEQGRGWLRASAARNLAPRGSREAIDFLRTVVTDPDSASNFKVQAIETLGLAKDSESIPMLQVAVYETERPSAERLVAADTLFLLGDVSGVLYLANCLQMPAGPERLRAATILGDRRIPATDALRRAAQAGDEELRFRSLRALARQGDKEAIATLRADFDRDLNAEPASGPAPTPETPEVPATSTGAPLEISEATSVQASRTARLFRTGQVLIEAGDTGPVEDFAMLARRPDPMVDRAMAAREVLRVDRDLGEELLLEVLRTGLLMDQIDAAPELARLGRTEGLVEVLSAAYREALEGDRFGLRLQALTALRELELPGSEEVLREALEDRYPRLQLEAGAALATMGHAAGISKLRQILASDDAIHSLMSAEALMEISGTPVVPPEAEAR